MVDPSLRSIQSSFAKFTESLPESKSRARNAFFQACGQFYEEWARVNIGLMGSDFLVCAKKVQKQMVFLDAPASFSRLQGPAEYYCNQWKHLKATLRSGCLETFHIKEFVEAHLFFKNCWIRECDLVCRDSPEHAQIKAPITIKLFYDIMLDWLIADSSFFQTAIQERDDSFFSSLPYHAALKVIQSSQGEEIPEIFAPFAQEFAQWQQDYSDLTWGEQSAILQQRHLLFDGGSVQMTERACTLFRNICKKVDELRDEITIQPINSIYQVVFSSMDRDLELACLISTLRWPLTSISSQEAIVHLRSLPNEHYTEFQKTFTWLPVCQAALSNNEADRWHCMHRILAIFRLAHLFSFRFCTIL